MKNASAKTTYLIKVVFNIIRPPVAKLQETVQFTNERIKDR